MHAGELTRALDRKLRKKYFAMARRHAYSLIRVNRNFFSVEQYTFDDVHTAERIRERLSEQPDRSLPSPGVTGYEFVQIGNTVVLFVADVHVREATQPLCDAITANLRAIAEASGR